MKSVGAYWTVRAAAHVGTIQMGTRPLDAIARARTPEAVATATANENAPAHAVDLETEVARLSWRENARLVTGWWRCWSAGRFALRPGRVVLEAAAPAAVVAVGGAARGSLGRRRVRVKTSGGFRGKTYGGLDVGVRGVEAVEEGVEVKASG